jgi:hypothetical protein
LRPIGGSRRRRLALVALIATGALALASCGGSDGTTPPPVAGDGPAAGPATEPSSKAALVDVSSVRELRQRFNADAGLPRLLLLLSPT